LYVNDLLRGEKNGKRIGTKLNIAVKVAEEANETNQSNISASIISRVSPFLKSMRLFISLKNSCFLNSAPFTNRK